MSIRAHTYFRITVVWLGMLAIWMTMHSIRHMMYGEGYTLAGHIQSALFATLLAVPMVLTARRWLDGGASVGLWAGLGLPLSLKAATKPFVIGVLSFLLPFFVGLAVVLGFGWSSVTPVAALMDILVFVPLLVVLVFLYEALPEELVFRGYLYQAFTERHSRIFSVAAQAVLFGLWGTILWSIRLDMLPLDRLIIFTSVAFVLGLVRMVTGSVWASIGLHTAFQTVAQLLLNEERGHFAIGGTETLQIVALGIVPFAVATMIAERAYASSEKRMK